MTLQHILPAILAAVFSLFAVPIASARAYAQGGFRHLRAQGSGITIFSIDGARPIATKKVHQSTKNRPNGYASATRFFPLTRDSHSYDKRLSQDWVTNSCRQNVAASGRSRFKGSKFKVSSWSVIVSRFLFHVFSGFNLEHGTLND
jgi:hypothetical protein